MLIGMIYTLGVAYLKMDADGSNFGGVGRGGRKWSYHSLVDGIINVAAIVIRTWVTFFGIVVDQVHFHRRANAVKSVLRASVVGRAEVELSVGKSVAKKERLEAGMEGMWDILSHEGSSGSSEEHNWAFHVVVSVHGQGVGGGVEIPFLHHVVAHHLGHPWVH